MSNTPTPESLAAAREFLRTEFDIDHNDYEYETCMNFVADDNVERRDILATLLDATAQSAARKAAESERARAVAIMAELARHGCTWLRTLKVIEIIEDNEHRAGGGA